MSKLDGVLVVALVACSARVVDELRRRRSSGT